MQEFLGPPVDPNPDLQTNVSANLTKCTNLSKSFVLKYVLCNVPTQMQVQTFEEEVPGKVGECIFDS